MKKQDIKKIIFILVASLIFYSVNAQIRLLSGFQKGSYYEMAKDIEAVVSPTVVVDTIFMTDVNGKDSFSFERSSSPFVKVLSSKGSLHNFNKITREPYPQIAFMQYDVLYEQQLKDIKKYKKRTDSIRVILPLGFEEIHLITLKNSKIKSLQDLKKKRVAIGSAGQGTSVTAGLIKEKTGIQWVDVQVSFADAMHALLTDKIDAFFFVGSAPVSKLNGLSPTFHNLKLVPVEDKALDDIYTKTTIPANTYHWLTEDVATYAVRLVLVSDVSKEKTQQDAENVRKLITEIQDNIGKLQEDGHPNWKKVDFNFSDIKWEPHEIAKDIFGL